MTNAPDCAILTTESREGTNQMKHQYQIYFYRDSKECAKSMVFNTVWGARLSAQKAMYLFNYDKGFVIDTITGEIMVEVNAK